MTDPLAVPRDPRARADDEFLEFVTRAIARDDLDLVPPPPNGARWVDRAVRHGILLPVIAALRASGHQVPTELMHHRTESAVRLLALKQELKDLGAALDRAGIAWAVVKGPVLSEVVYARAARRESADLDLVVAPAHLRDAIETLTGRGVRRLQVDWSQRTWAQGAEVPMVTSAGTVIDVHWHLLNRPAARRAYSLHTESLLRRRVTRDLGGVEAPTLDDLDLVLHVLLHACVDGCGRLRAVLDAQQCVSWLESRNWHPRELAQRASAGDLVSPSWLVLSVTAGVLDPRVERWRDAFPTPSHWARVVHRLAQRTGGSPMTDGLTRRLVRYTAPKSLSSLAGVGGYAASRVIRTVRPDKTQVLGVASTTFEPDFEQFLSRVAASTSVPSQHH